MKLFLFLVWLIATTPFALIGFVSAFVVTSVRVGWNTYVEDFLRFITEGVA